MLLILAGLSLGIAADLLMRVPDPPALNLFVWLVSVAITAFAFARRISGVTAGRRAWLLMAALFAAGLVWRDAPPLKLLALAVVTMSFALAAYRPTAEWIRYSGVARYAAAWMMGALSAWVGSGFALLDAIRTAPRADARRARWRGATGVARGLAIAAPPVVVFGALFMSADAVFSRLVVSLVRVDVEVVMGHVLLTGVAAWIATGYVRGFLTGTERPLLAAMAMSDGGAPRRVALSITEVATAMSAIDVLFLAFVIVQFRYLFGGDSLVQVTAGLSYAEYARRGFFELVAAALLVVPVLLVADWLLDARDRRDRLIFRSLAAALIVLVLAIAASAFERLRLYYASYGVTEQRLYGAVALVWISAMLVWLAATVLRGRRDAFAFGALTSGMATVALLFAIAPDAVVARTNIARLAAPGVSAPFDAVYAAGLSGDATPLLIEALPALPGDVRCQLAKRVLARWPPGRSLSLRGWNWSAARASRAVQAHEAQLRSMVCANMRCGSP